MKCEEYGALLTGDAHLQKVIQMATNVASSKATVLIHGESGTGKELLARFIHQKSPRAQRNFVAINCAAVPEGLLESELFGYEKGAFTGAFQQKLGKFELSSNSTLLLDEISELPLALQSKLLRVLQEEEVDRLGGRTPVKVNLRIIATTNKDLKAMVQDKQFREDLYYRLNVIPLHIPALRQRPTDIAILAQHFAKVSAILNNRQVTLHAAAIDKLLAWSWPGNVRELENVIERSVLICDQNQITPEHLMFDATKVKTGAHEIMTIAEMEKQLIYKTLDSTNNNRTQAARLLGISIRTLRNKLHEYNDEAKGVSHG